MIKKILLCVLILGGVSVTGLHAGWFGFGKPWTEAQIAEKGYTPIRDAGKKLVGYETRIEKVTRKDSFGNKMPPVTEYVLYALSGAKLATARLAEREYTTYIPNLKKEAGAEEKIIDIWTADLMQRHSAAVRQLELGSYLVPVLEQLHVDLLVYGDLLFIP